MIGEYKKYLDTKSRSNVFYFNGRKYKYCTSFYNYSFSTERTIEIPIVLGEIREGMKVLEVGNVLNRKGDIKTDVVDKYEKAPGVINQDIVDFDPGIMYDLIISISTLEHVGFDEPETEPDKTIRAVEKMTSLIKPGGKIIITVPLGYNKYMDERLADRRIPYTKIKIMEKINKYEWEEREYDPMKKYIFNYRYPFSNAIAIVYIY